MITEAIAIPVIIGIIQALKIVGLPSRYAPVVSLGLGVVIMVASGTQTASDIFSGLIVGLSASGLYSGVKAQNKAE